MEPPLVTKLERKPGILHIHVVPPKTSITRFERLKTWVWNFILPPHLRLELKEDNK